MDANLVSCPKCGHTVNSTGKFCTYCGVAFLESESDPQADNQQPGGQSETMTTTTASALPAQELEAAVETAAESETVPVAVQTPPADSSPVELSSAASEPPVEESPDDSEAEVEIEMVDLKPMTAAGDPSADVPDSGSQPEAETTPDVAAPLEQASSGEGIVPEAGDPVTIGAPAGSSMLPPQPEILELMEEDPLESETLGTEIAAMVNAQEPLPGLAQPVSTDSPTPVADVTPPAVADQPSVEADIVPMPAVSAVSNDDAASEVAAVQPDTLQPEVSAQALATGTPVADIQPSSDGDQAAAGVPPGDADATFDNEALKTQSEAQLAAEAMKIENAAREMTDAVKQQKKELARAEASQDQRAESTGTETVKKKQGALKHKQRIKEKAIALKRKKMALARAAALKKQKQAQSAKRASKAQSSSPVVQTGTDSGAVAVRSLPLNTKMLKLLKKYQGRAVGINYDNSADIREAELVEVNDNFFSVFVKDKQLHYHYPLSTILTVIEGQDGVSLGGAEKTAKFNAVIKVYPLVLF